jgi:uncharacterized protein YndB with AHSA1/START domain
MSEGVVEIERRVAASPATVFSYFTDPKKHEQWQGLIADLDARPGGRYVVHFGDCDRIRGEYVVVDPPHRLVLTWGWEGDGKWMPDELRAITAGSSFLEINFIADGTDTLLRLRHSGLPPDNSFFLSGWNVFLPRLEAIVSGSDPGPDPLGVVFAASTPTDRSS